MDNIITFNIVKDQFSNRKQYENWIFNELKKGNIVKVRKDLYVKIDKETGEVLADDYEIACKISPTAHLCYHSAVSYLGMSNQGYFEIMVGSQTEFNNFEFNGVRYIYKNDTDMSNLKCNNNETIIFTSLERTIVDCIDRIDLVGGIEELVHFLNMVKYVDENKLLECIVLKNKGILYKKCGFFLNIYKSNMGLSSKFFNKLKSFVTYENEYLDKSEKDNHLDKDWNLIVPNRLIKSEYVDIEEGLY